ncbi:hypothetical protein [Exiguobacterium acetylicum]|uniref:hypothetical protein n=1 Tax=Exiguobacterium acetylicum TaxID=41170 RepID=UPI001EE24468|nr:hypothetical protein [Exiguobacterium acetylicum]UKS54891.1 hypothetical protein K6T22_10035 [Exiguobacterium acetylicum]
MITAEKMLRRGRLYVEDTYLELGVSGTVGQRMILVEAMALLDRALETKRTESEYLQQFESAIERLEQLLNDMHGIRFNKDRTFTLQLVTTLRQISSGEEVSA